MTPTPGTECDSNKEENNSSTTADLYEGLDSNLPFAVKILNTKLRCDVCHVDLNGGVYEAHYKGKKHAKRLKCFLISEGYRLVNDEYIKANTGGTSLYCKYCDLHLTSEIMAQSHYLGKKHKEAVRKFTELGFLSRKKEICNDTSNRFGIGQAFVAPSAMVESPELESFQCIPCQVRCTSQFELDKHLVGIKHKKKCTTSTDVNATNAGIPVDNLLKSVLHESDSTKSHMDLSIFRTPSGGYYCQTCDISFNSASQYVQHTDGKKHNSKLKICASPAVV